MGVLISAMTASITITAKSSIKVKPFFSHIYNTKFFFKRKTVDSIYQQPKTLEFY